MGLYTFKAGDSAQVAENLDANFQYLLSLIQGTNGVSGAGTSQGQSTAVGYANPWFLGKGNAIGSASVRAYNGSLSNSQIVGTASGGEAVHAIGAANFSGVGTSTGASTASAYDSNNAAAGTGTATGSETVSGVGGYAKNLVGTATGGEQVNAISNANKAATGTGTGSSNAIATGKGGASESANRSFVAAPNIVMYVSSVPGTASSTLVNMELSAAPGYPVINGTNDTAISNIVELYYNNHTVYAENTAANWYQWSGTVGTWNVTSDPRPAFITESVEGYELTVVGDTIYGSSTPGTAAPSTATVGNGLDTWAITASPGQIIHNGSVDTSTANVTELFYTGHYLWQLNSSGYWYQWQGANGWTGGTTTSPVPTTPSLNIATLNNQFVGSCFDVSGTYEDYTTGAGTYATPGNGSVTDGSGNVWTITTGNDLLENGAQLPGDAGANTGAVDYYNGTIYGQDATSKAWYTWDPNAQTFNAASAPGNLPTANGGTGIPHLQYQDAGSSTWNEFSSTANVGAADWKFVHPPINAVNGSFYVKIRDANNTGMVVQSNTFQIYNQGVTTLTGISLSGTTTTANQPAGAVIGTVTVTTAGGSFTGSYTLSDTTHFKMVGNQLETAAVIGAGSYPLTINAVQSGATGSPQTLNTTIVASAESAQATVLNSTSGSIIGSSTPGTSGGQETWKLSGSGAGSFSAVLNGVTQTGDSAITELYYINHTLYKETGTSNAWLYFNGTITNQQAQWTSCSSPIPVVEIDGQVVSSESIQAGVSNEPVGTNGTLTLVSAGSALSGATWTWGGTDAAKFQIVSGNTLKTVGSLPAGTYNITLTATLN